jgi:hypothetical protein
MIPRKKLLPRRGFGFGTSFCSFTQHVLVAISTFMPNGQTVYWSTHYYFAREVMR